jgi:hypothetical protein
MLDKWVDQVKDELGLEGDTDIDTLLDVARVAAHKVERRAAPITTYLMGLAVAQGADVRAAAKSIVARARVWEPTESDE